MESHLCSLISSSSSVVDDATQYTWLFMLRAHLCTSSNPFLCDKALTFFLTAGD